MRHAVLVKVQLQTIWAEVDTESGLAIEHVDPPVTIPADQWAGFYDKWAQDWIQMRERVAQADVDREKVALNGN